MSHFASGKWPDNYGVIPYANTLTAGQTYPGSKVPFTTPTSTATGSTEGTDKFTFTAPEAGLYRVSVYMANSTVSDAATTDLIEPVVTFTDAVGAKSAVNLNTGATQATLNHKTSGAQAAWVGLVSVAAAAGTIVVAIKDTVTGAKTVGAVNVYVVVEKIAQ